MRGPKEFFPHLRRKDWSIRWVHFMEESKQLSDSLLLDWESMNCVKWACQGVEELVGHNPYEELGFDAQVKSLATAARAIMNSDLGNNLDEIFKAVFPEVPLAQAQAGDIILARTTNWDEAVETGAGMLMPHAVCLADPPFYWCVVPEGLAQGHLYEDGVTALAVGRMIP